MQPKGFEKWWSQFFQTTNQTGVWKGNANEFYALTVLRVLSWTILTAGGLIALALLLGAFLHARTSAEGTLTAIWVLLSSIFFWTITRAFASILDYLHDIRVGLLKIRDKLDEVSSFEDAK